MWRDWSPYVSVAERRARAARAMKKRAGRGLAVEPVIIEGRSIARSFWGEAWCNHLEAMGDLASRLPRGRSYVRNGSVCHLGIEPGRVHAFVMGNELYEVELTVTRLPAAKWRAIKARCAGAVGSVLELLEGRLSAQVMRVVTHAEAGLFPERRQLRMSCSCPDWASVCKHVAAAFYGVGARLDERPELLFELRGVDHRDLIGEGTRALSQVTGRGSGRRLASDNLADVFGIDLAPGAPAAPDAPAVTRKRKSAGNGAAVVGARSSAATSRALRKPAPATRPVVPPQAQARFTAAKVRALRQRLNLDAAEFARLLGVSPATVARWELAAGPIKPQTRPRAALERASAMSPAQARRALAERRH